MVTEESSNVRQSDETRQKYENRESELRIVLLKADVKLIVVKERRKPAVNRQ